MKQLCWCHLMDQAWAQSRCHSARKRWTRSRRRCETRRRQLGEWTLLQLLDEYTRSAIAMYVYVNHNVDGASALLEEYTRGGGH